MHQKLTETIGRAFRNRPPMIRDNAFRALLRESIEWLRLLRRMDIALEVRS